VTNGDSEAVCDEVGEGADIIWPITEMQGLNCVDPDRDAPNVAEA